MEDDVVASDVVEVTVGVVGRAHGVRGEVSVEVRTDEVERRFAPGTVLFTPAGRSLRVEATRQVSGRLVVSFAGVADRTLAEDLNGTELVARVPATEEPTGDEEYYDRQLVGLAVLDARGNQAGTITNVLHNYAQDLLVVDAGGSERLVPFVLALVPIVDLAGGHVQLADLPGLLDDLPDIH